MDAISETTRPTGTADRCSWGDNGDANGALSIPTSQPHGAAKEWRRGKPCPHIRTRCKTCSQKQ
jgi:hypothetical protein